MSKPKSGIALGKRIKSLRTKRGLTQERLSEIAGLSLKHFGELERGKANPNLLSLERIADGLGGPIVDMFDLEHEQISINVLRDKLVDQINAADESDCRLFYQIFKCLRR